MRKTLLVRLIVLSADVSYCIYILHFSHTGVVSCLGPGIRFTHYWINQISMKFLDQS